MVFFEKFLVKNDQKYVLGHNGLKIKQHRRRGDNFRDIVGGTFYQILTEQNCTSVIILVVP